MLWAKHFSFFSLSVICCCCLFSYTSHFLEPVWVIYMGHLLSTNGLRLKKRSQTLRKKKKRRSCFLRGPCMLCFFIHSSSSDGFDAECCSDSRLTKLSSPEDCAKFLLSPAELAVWECQGRSLLSSVPARLIGPPVLFCTDYSEMVCKRKSGEPQPLAPCKQPRCTSQETAESEDDEKNAKQALLPQLCPLPSSSSSSFSEEQESSVVGLQMDSGLTNLSNDKIPEICSSSSSSCLLSHSSVGEEGRSAEIMDTSRINHLPSSILLKVCTLGSAGLSCLHVMRHNNII